MTSSRIFLYFCLAFVAGIFAASFLNVAPFLMLGILLFGIFLIAVLGQHKKFAVIGFCLFFFILGIWRHQSAESKIVYPEEGNITFAGIVTKEPDIRSNSIKLTIKCNEKCSRYILVTANRYPEYKYGDKLKITGLLKNPPVFSAPLGRASLSSAGRDGFNYRDYLKKDGVAAVMDYPKIELLDSGFGNPATELLFSFKNKFLGAARIFISPPQEGLLEALTFGQESNISKEWKDKFNFTGTRHIAAVSGMNITIISSLIFSFILGLGLRKNIAFYLAVGLLFLYILMIGAPSSAVRAFIMAGIWLFAEKLGRTNSGLRAVFFAAAFILALNPLLLTKDIGFQLSFLAILGLFYLQSLFSYRLRFLPNYKIFPIRTTLSATLSAQVFTTPILVYNFGYFSLISFTANVLIVPVLAPVTILIFIFGISGMIFSPLGFLLSLPVWLSLTYILKIIDLFSRLTFASLSINNLHWIWLIIFYFVLGGFIWWYNRNVWKLSSNFTPSNKHGW